MNDHTKDTVPEGGAKTFDGYDLVASVTSELEPGDTADFTFDDLLPQVRIHHMEGVSVAFNQSVQNGNVGTLAMRVIHDTLMRAYLFRKDEDGVTIFKVSAGLNVT